MMERADRRLHAQQAWKPFKHVCYWGGRVFWPFRARLYSGLAKVFLYAEHAFDSTEGSHSYHNQLDLRHPKQLQQWRRKFEETQKHSLL